jgi:hypothetical protein
VLFHPSTDACFIILWRFNVRYIATPIAGGGAIEDRPSLINKKIRALKKSYPHAYYEYQAPRSPKPELENVFSYQSAINYRNEVLLPTIHKIDTENTRSIPTGRYEDMKGGVKKKFDPSTGMVIAGDRGVGRGDYKKEDLVSGRVYQEDVYKYTSHQEALDENLDVANTAKLDQFRRENPNLRTRFTGRDVDLDQMRRVSIYGNIGDGGQYNTRLSEFILEDQGASEAELVSCIHQIVKIHEFLYLCKVVHGDMHMGNIKVIRTPESVLLKAFDFGKSKVKSLEKNYTRTDLRYLLLKKAVSGSFETFKRNTWRSSTSKEMTKHYPLHKASSLLIKTFHPSSFPEMLIDSKIQEYGSQLLDNLESIRLNKINVAEQNIDREILCIQRMFELFSNQLVNCIYQVPCKIGGGSDFS